MVLAIGAYVYKIITYNKVLKMLQYYIGSAHSIVHTIYTSTQLARIHNISRFAYLLLIWKRFSEAAASHTLTQRHCIIILLFPILYITEDDSKYITKIGYTRWRDDLGYYVLVGVTIYK